MLPLAYLPVLLICSVASAAPVETVHKREVTVSFNPGSINLAPSSSPFLSIDSSPNDISFLYQTDANFVAYNTNSGHGVAVWNSQTGGRSCSAPNNCSLVFQYDGNLVEYYNQQPIWYTGTGSGIGKQLYFQNVSPYLYITNAQGQIAWKSS